MHVYLFDCLWLYTNVSTFFGQNLVDGLLKWLPLDNKPVITNFSTSDLLLIPHDFFLSETNDLYQMSWRLIHNTKDQTYDPWITYLNSGWPQKSKTEIPWFSLTKKIFFSWYFCTVNYQNTAIKPIVFNLPFFNK